jgi:hypothetical protein
MKRFSFALVIGAFALLPLGLSQPASAHDYYDGYSGDSRLERGIDRDRAKLDHEHAEHRYYSEREQQALRDGHYLSAWWFGWRRHHEEREINARRAGLHRDHGRLDRYAY